MESLAEESNATLTLSKFPPPDVSQGIEESKEEEQSEWTSLRLEISVTEEEIRSRMAGILSQELKEKFQRLLQWKERTRKDPKYLWDTLDFNNNTEELEKAEIQQLISEIRILLTNSTQDQREILEEILDRSKLNSQSKHKLRKYWRSFCDTLIAIKHVLLKEELKLDSDVLLTLATLEVSLIDHGQIAGLLSSNEFEKMRRLNNLFCLQNLAGTACNAIMRNPCAQKTILKTVELPRGYEEFQEKVQRFCELLGEDDESKIKSSQEYKDRFEGVEQKLGHYHACLWVKNDLLNLKEGKTLLQILNDNCILKDYIFEHSNITLAEARNLRQVREVQEE